MVYTLFTIIILGMVLGEIQNYQDEIAGYLTERAKKRVKTKAQAFYSSNAWHKAKREVRALQMEISGFDHIYCEDCGITSLDIDDSKRRVVMSVGHDRARSTHDHLKLVLDNLFNQCMPCNRAQGINGRMKTGYNTR